MWNSDERKQTTRLALQELRVREMELIGGQQLNNKENELKPTEVKLKMQNRQNNNEQMRRKFKQ